MGKAFLRWFCLAVSMVIAVSCAKKDENPYRREMDGLLHDNKLLKSELFKTDRLRAEQQSRADGLERQLNELISKNAEYDKRVAVLEVEKKALQAQVDSIESQRLAAKNARDQEEQKRQQQLAEVAKANQKPATQPPFRVFDVMYVGDKEVSGRIKEVGRFSIRNYTDTPIKIKAYTSRTNGVGFGYASATIPPNNSSNAVFIAAKPKMILKGSGAGHEEVFTW